MNTNTFCQAEKHAFWNWCKQCCQWVGRKHHQREEVHNRGYGGREPWCHSQTMQQIVTNCCKAVKQGDLLLPVGTHWENVVPHCSTKQAFPSVFAYCKWSKTGRGKGLEWDLLVLHMVINFIYVDSTIHVHMTLLCGQSCWAWTCFNSVVFVVGVWLV